MFQDFRRIASHQRTGRYILCNHRACCNHSTIANRHTWQNRGMTSYPNIVTNRNRQSIDIKHATFRFQTMPCCVDAHIRTDQAVIAYADLCQVEHRAVVVSMEIFAHMDVFAKVTMEVVANKGITANRSEQFPYDFLFLCLLS